MYDTYLRFFPLPHSIPQSLLPLSFLFLLIFDMVSEPQKRIQSHDQSKEHTKCKTLLGFLEY